MTESKSRKFVAPTRNEYHDFYHKYISLVDPNTVWDEFCAQPDQLMAQLGDLEDAVVDVLHEPYTWTLKQVVGHLIDGERIFSDRMIRIAVGDDVPIPGIDQQMFVNAIDYQQLPMSDLLDEFLLLRQANRLAVARLSDEALARVGIASDSPVSARANFFILVGHVRHHLEIMNRRIASAKVG